MTHVYDNIMGSYQNITESLLLLFKIGYNNRRYIVIMLSLPQRSLIVIDIHHSISSPGYNYEQSISGMRQTYFHKIMYKFLSIFKQVAILTS